MATDIDAIYHILEQEYPKWHVPLADLVKAQTNDPFKVLVATVLSAQTKDSLTAVICQKLFLKIRNVDDLDKIPESELAGLIYPVSYYKTKARHLKGLATMLIDDFDRTVPEEIDALVKLPGVGRKTANVVLASAFRKPAIGVDTHVNRISNRLGYIRTKTREETEQRLRQKLPKEYWVRYNTYLVALGQRLCHPTSPKCSECPLNGHCRKVGVQRSR